MTREEKNKEKINEVEREEKNKKITSIIKTSMKILLILLILGFSFYSYTTYISTTKINVREYRITNSKIPDTFNGLKIIQISDLHYGTTMFNEDLKKIIKLSNERKPDIIVFTGDLIYQDYKMTNKEEEELTKQLKKLNATLGKYAIIGDEDNEEKISTIFNQSDFILLKNEYDLIYKNDNNPILLIGLSSLLTNKQNIEEGYKYFKQEVYNSNIYTITLVHEPDSSDDIINAYNTDLILSGHSHNGNIRIPILNKSIIKVDGAKKYDQDYYKINNTDLYISSGLGTKKGIRLFCRPTISLYRLSNK